MTVMHALSEGDLDARAWKAFKPVSNIFLLMSVELDLDTELGVYVYIGSTAISPGLYKTYIS